MILKVYSIRDSKAEVFNTPFFQKTHGEAERSFKQLASDEKSTVWKFAEDYDLYFLGEYNDEKGELKSLDTPQHVMKAIIAKQTNSAPLQSV